MRNKKLLILLGGLLLFIASCKKNGYIAEPDGKATQTGITGVAGSSITNYSISETFESGSAKSAYADGTVTLSTGVWDLNDALIGNTASDAKDGTWSARLRTGSIGMNFDVKGITQISIKHAKYGNDAAGGWQLMMSTDGGATYNNLGNAITETSTTLVTDSFKVIGVTQARFKIVKTSATIRVNIDDITFKGTGDPGITVGPPDTQGPDTTATSTPTGTRGVTVGADAPPATGDNSNLLFGNPTGALSGSTASGDNYLLDQGYYVESYNNTREEPNWVSWHLDNTNTTNVAGRQDNFAGFAGFPTISGITWNVVQSNSYSGSGFDRGHNCPSADRTSSVAANSATFLMTNMIPQAPQNNQQTWANFENYLRSLTETGNEVYIIMGSYGVGGTGSNGAANTVGPLKVTVPAQVWKVAVVLPVGNGDLARVNANTRIIAINTPNNQTINSDWTQYITTMGSIESAGNVKLLSALSQSIHDALAAKKDAGK